MPESSGGRRSDSKPDNFSFPSFKEPDITAERRREFYRVARAYADSHPSDPFMFARIYCHLRRGIITPAEVSADTTIVKS
jgi:hypothetical protein